MDEFIKQQINTIMDGMNTGLYINLVGDVFKSTHLQEDLSAIANDKDIYKIFGFTFPTNINLDVVLRDYNNKTDYLTKHIKDNLFTILAKRRIFESVCLSYNGEKTYPVSNSPSIKMIKKIQKNAQKN